jgi:pseudouridine-5'-monophosphatase
LEIVTAIKATGIPLGVATGSSGCTFAIKRTNHQKLFSCFDHIVVGDDLSVKEGKPAPDCFLEAARRLGQPNAGRCLVVEDSPNGVRAGLAAGMHVAWVPDRCLEVRKNVPELVADPRVVLFDSLINLQIVLLNH